MSEKKEVSLIDDYYQNSLEIFCGTGALLFIVYWVVELVSYYDFFDMGIGINYVVNLLKELFS